MGTIRSTNLAKAQHESDSPLKYEAFITYEYQVDGKTFTSSSIAVNRESVEMMKADSLRLGGLYPLHALVAVNYNPENPAEAVLEPGGNLNPLGVVLFGAGLAVIGLLVLLDVL